MTDKLLVMTLCGSRREAQAMAGALLRQRLIACANLGGPVESRYRWQGREERAREYPLLLKTTRARFTQVEREIRRRHSYQVPEIVALEIARGSAAYLRWMAEVTAPPRPKSAAKPSAKSKRR